MKKLIFIKFGGSLITVKDQPETARPEVIQKLAKQIKELTETMPDVQLVLGNGAGSFGHYKVIEHALKEGIIEPSQWLGYAEVQDSVARLNRMVLHELLQQKVAAATLQPSAVFTARNKRKETVSLDSYFSWITSGITPVFYGDIIADSERGCVIFSTEDIFHHLIEASLARGITVQAVVHVGQVEGVLDKNNKVIPLITQENWPSVQGNIFAPKGYDVTGGMKHKIESSLELATKGIETFLVSGEITGILTDCLLNKSFHGTRIA